MSKSLTVVISGPAKSGKSTVGLLLARSLRAYRIGVKEEICDMKPSVLVSRRRNLFNLLKVMYKKGTKVVIRTDAS